MKTIKEFMLDNPKWFDGSATTYAKMNHAIKTGRIKAKMIKGKKRIYDGQEINQNTENNGLSESQNIEYDLKDKKLSIDIKLKQQQLYESRLVMLQKFYDAFDTFFLSPYIAELSNIVRKNGTKELIKKWNKQLEAGSKNEYTELQAELEKIATQ